MLRARPTKSPSRARGETGRRAGLRSRCPSGFCGFESRRAHNLVYRLDMRRREPAQIPGVSADRKKRSKGAL